LSGIAKADKEEAMRVARKLENTDEKELLLGIASIYVEYGNDSCNNFFVNLQDKVTGYEQIPYVAMYGRFLQQCSDTAVERGIPIIGSIMKNGDNRYVKYYAKNALQGLLSVYQGRKDDITSQMNDVKSKADGALKLTDLQKKSDSADAIIAQLNSALGQ